MEKTQQPNVTSKEQVAERLQALPGFTKSVYIALHAALYAEPFFSDVTALDLAEKLACSTMAINASIGHLELAGLVYSEYFSSNRNKPTCFLHTYEHDRFEEI